MEKVRAGETWIWFGGKRGEVPMMALSASSSKLGRRPSASIPAIPFHDISPSSRGLLLTELARLIVNLRLDSGTALSTWISKGTGPRSVCVCYRIFGLMDGLI